MVRCSGVPPSACTRSNILVHAALADACTASKSQPGISAERLVSAFSMLTNEIPIFMTTGSAPLGNETYAPACRPEAEVVPAVILSLQVPDAVNGFSNLAAK